MAPSKKTLTGPELQHLLQDLLDWVHEDGMLVRYWNFKDFVEAMTFVNHVAALAEAAQHHPDLDIRYNRVKVALVSHDAGGITERDASMARRLNSEFAA